MSNAEERSKRWRYDSTLAIGNNEISVRSNSMSALIYILSQIEALALELAAERQKLNNALCGVCGKSRDLLHKKHGCSCLDSFNWGIDF